MSDIRVAIVDDEKLVAAMLEAWINQLQGFTVCGIANDGVAGLEMCRKEKPDILLLDLEMPEMDGLSLARELLKDLPATKIIVVTSHLDAYCIHEISRLGIPGYVDKSSSTEALLRALQAVAKGGRYYTPIYQWVRDTQLSSSEAYHKIITPKELSVLTLLASGKDDAAIAKELDIAEDTVATHRRNLRLKLNAHNDRDLVNYARQWGLLPLVKPERNP